MLELRHGRLGVLVSVVGTLGIMGCAKGDGAPVSVSVGKADGAKVSFQFKNTTEKEATAGYLYVYCYDADDKQLGLDNLTLGLAMKSHATKDDAVSISCGGAKVKTYEAEWVYVNFADGTKWENPVKPPDKRPKGGAKK